MPDRIEAVEFHTLTHPLSKRYGDANGLKTERRTTLVRITTSDGVVGWGEFSVRNMPTDYLSAAADMLKGASAIASRPLCEKLSTLSPRLAAGAEIALWDIRGKVAGLSVCQLLGGPYRPAQPAYASLQNVCEAEDVASAAIDEARAAIAKGYRSLKMKVGWHRPEVDADWVDRVLDALPADVPLAIDANRALELSTAKKLLQRLSRPDRIMWFEEPVSRAWPEAYRELREFTPIAISGGESMDITMLEQVISSRAMDIINPDLVSHGGISMMQRLYTMCDVHGVRLVPHVFDGQLVRVATLHFLAAQPSWAERQSVHPASPLECDVSPNALRDDLLEVELAPDSNGCVAVPSGPGLGITVNERILHTHAVKRAA